MLGGGPAGSTLASSLLTHAPETPVVIVEKEKFPRHRIGESMLLDTTRILKEIGVYGAIEQGGFLKKVGATYIWGQSREPWSVNFADLENMPPADADLKNWPYAFQVDRSRYDKILLDHAQSLGASVFHGVKVVDLIWEGKRLTGAVVEDEKNNRREIRARLTADCTGLNSQVSRARNLRQMDNNLNNVAIYAYYQGKGWSPYYTRHPDYSHIFVCSVKNGWVWNIPLSQEIISVGLVMPRRFVGDVTAQHAAALYEEALAQTPELKGFLKGAKRLKSFQGTGKEINIVADWSYTSRSMAGPGWVLCGDAAGFVDPILTTGVHFAHVAGYLAANTWLTTRDLGAAKGTFFWREYSRYYREMLAVYRQMARYWYRNNASVPGWWENATRWLSATRVKGATDREAFITLITGFTGGEAFHTQSYTGDVEFFGQRIAGHVAERLMGRLVDRLETPGLRARPVFLSQPVLCPGAMLERGKGRMIEVKRLTFRPAPKGLPRFERLLTPELVQWVPLVDGQRTVAELASALHRLHGRPDADKEHSLRQVISILSDLRRMNVLKW